MAGNGRLSVRMLKAVAALAEGKRFHVAAKRANVSVRTLHRWRSDPVFAAALASTRDAAFADALAELRRATSEAVAVCAALMRPAVAADVRLIAARTVLASVLRVNEAVEVERRLAAIEAALAARGET